LYQPTQHSPQHITVAACAAVFATPRHRSNVVGACDLHGLPAKRRGTSTPLGFVSEHWRGRAEARNAFSLGLHHYGIGCCWAIMPLMFVVGTGSVGWMVSAPLGVALVTLAGIVVAVSLRAMRGLEWSGTSSWTLRQTSPASSRRRR
jgi:hypothetical protein